MFVIVVGISAALWHFFSAMGAEFSLGALFGVSVMQFCHRYVHGRWIEF